MRASATTGRYAALVLCLLLTLQCAAEILSPDDYRRDVVEARLRRSGPRPVEGVWLLTAGNSTRALIAIERTDSTRFDAGSYRLVVVEAEDRAIVPGTVIGTAVAAARENTFDARIASEIRGGHTLRHKSYTLTLTDNSDRLEIAPRAGKLRVSFYAAIPYLFVRPSVSTRDGSHTQPPVPGAVKVFPRPSKPHSPVYL